MGSNKPIDLMDIMKNMSDVAVQVFLPKDLHRELKMQSASEDQPIANWVFQAIKEKLERSDKSRRFSSDLGQLVPRRSARG